MEFEHDEFTATNTSFNTPFCPKKHGTYSVSITAENGLVKE